MSKFTIVRGEDGFGSQLLSVLSGIAISLKFTNREFVHTPLTGIKLLDKNTTQNTDLQRANSMLDQFVNRCGFKTRTNETDLTEIPFFHYYIRDNGFDRIYDDSFCELVSRSYPLDYPDDFDRDKHHISIHIRRGTDIYKEDDITCRIIPSDVYSELVDKLVKLYPDSIIHVFSWTDPKIAVSANTPNIKFHIVEFGDLFLDDFNRMVHSDILFVGSSTMSVTAGLLSKGKVISIPSVSNTPMNSLPILEKWKRNYEEVFNV